MKFIVRFVYLIVALYWGLVLGDKQLALLSLILAEVFIINLNLEKGIGNNEQ